MIKTTDPVQFKRGIDLIVEFREAIPQGFRVQTDPYFNFTAGTTIFVPRLDTLRRVLGI